MDHEEATIEAVEKGGFFRLKENGKVYVRGEYNRSTKKYEYSDFEDINNRHEKKKGTKVLINFTF